MHTPLLLCVIYTYRLLYHDGPYLRHYLTFQVQTIYGVYTDYYWLKQRVFLFLNKTGNSPIRKYDILL